MFSVATILVLLVVSPKRIDTVIELMKLIISSGNGFAIPTVLFAIYAPKLLERFLERRTS